MINIKIIWLAIAIIFGILELFTLSLTMIWFSVGAFCAILVSFFTNNLQIQICVFVIVSFFLLYIATRTLLKMDKSQKSKWKSTNTNIDAIIGQKGFVISEISPENSGIVKINSEEWSAKAKDFNETISVGTEVIVERIEGVKVIVYTV